MINWNKKTGIKRKSVTYTMVNPHVDSYPTQSYPSSTSVDGLPVDKKKYREEKKWLLEEDGTQISTKKHVEEKDGKYYALFKKKIYKEFLSKEEAEEYLSRQSNLKLIGQLDPIIIDGYTADIKGEFLKQFSEKGVENVNTFDVITAFQEEKKIDPKVMSEIMKRLLENGDILEETFERWRVMTYGTKKEGHILDNPNRIVIKNNFYPKGLKEIEIYNYYTSSQIKKKILAGCKDKGFFIITKTGFDKKNKIIRRADDKKNLLKMSEENCDRFVVSSLNMGVHLVLGGTANCYLADLDPGTKVPFKKVKDAAKDIYAMYKKLPEVKEATIRYTGGKGLHVLGFLDKAGKVKDVQKENQDYLEDFIKDDNDLTLKNTSDQTKLRINTSLIYRKGSYRVLYSLNWKTGLVDTEIELNDLDKFEKEDATVYKVAEKLGIDLTK